MNWIDAYPIADVAARVFQSERPDGHGPRSRILRDAPVKTLRFLWQTKDPSIRALVAGRVNAWRAKWDIAHKDGKCVMTCDDKRDGLAERVEAREKARMAR
jgi:hypothetical protein